MSLRNLFFALILCLFCGQIAAQQEGEREFKTLKYLDIFFDIYKELDLCYVDSLDPETVLQAAIDGLLYETDPYTSFIPEEETEEYETLTTGQYAGIGVYIDKMFGGYFVSNIVKGHPADKAGVRPGDELLSIDKKSTKNMTSDEISEAFRGVPATTIDITIRRQKDNKAQEIKLTLVREIITIPNVTYFGKLGDIGFIRLYHFNPNAAEEFKNAFLTLKKQDIKSLIIDVRNNSGGLVAEAVDIINFFVPQGQEVVSLKGKVKQWDKTYSTRFEPLDTIIPICVIVDDETASAAEILAGAMQDFDRAIVLGERTYGKGLVQITRPLPFDAHLKITTARYYIPSGRCIQARDFAHRNADGSVAAIPDSLIKEFKTLRLHRTVKDGGGIYPDIYIKRPEPSRLAVRLYNNPHFMEYAMKYVIAHDSIAAPDKFSLSDADFDDFIKYMLDAGFDYNSEIEDLLDRLQFYAKQDQAADLLADIQAFKERHPHNLPKMILQKKAEIKALLEEEIIAIVYSSAGRVQYLIQDDIPIKKAIEALKNNYVLQELTL